jgi:hypothetical protein
MASTISAVSALASGIATQKVMMEVAVAVMKKSNDLAKQGGEAIVQLIENPTPQKCLHCVILKPKSSIPVL